MEGRAQGDDGVVRVETFDRMNGDCQSQMDDVGCHPRELL